MAGLPNALTSQRWFQPISRTERRSVEEARKMLHLGEKQSCWRGDYRERAAVAVTGLGGSTAGGSGSLRVRPSALRSSASTC